MPLPTLVRLPEPVRAPENVVLASLLPTLRATAADALLARLSVPGPVSPPKVAAVSVPKLREPLPLVSSVLFCMASALPKASEPPLTSVFPE